MAPKTVMENDPKQFPEIATKRLLLRRLQPLDWEMVSFLRSDHRVNEFVKRPSAATKEKALGFIAKTNAAIARGELYYWSITEQNKRGMIGSICLWNFSRDKKTAEVGYDLSPIFQGKGIMDESLKSIISFGFQHLDLETIEAYTHRLNKRSIALLTRNGFKVVPGKIDGHNADNSVYEIKKKQWSTKMCNVQSRR